MIRWRGILLLLLAGGAIALAGCGDDAPVMPSGTFEAVEIDLSPRTPGQILRVGADEGDRVAQGDTLLVVDTALLRLQVGEAEAALNAADAQRTTAVDRRRQAQQKLDLARTTLQRIEKLHAAGNATTQQLDEARTQRDLSQTEVSAATGAIATIDAQKAQTEARLAVLRRQIADGVLLAPGDGTILLRAAEPGEMGAPGAVALRMADLSRLELRVYLGETELGQVRIGQKVKIHVDAFADRTFDGTVTWISSEAEFTPKNAQTRDARAQLVYAVKLEVPNADGSLHIGMPAEADPGK